MKQRHMVQVINRKRYDTAKAVLLAHDVRWDGHNWERDGRNTFLYQTPNGAFFIVRQTNWQGEEDSLEPLEPEMAYMIYERLPEHEVDVSVAFPDVVIEDA